MDGALLGVIIGGIIGVTGSVVGPFCLAHVQRRAERKNLACALAAEIAALIDIVETGVYRGASTNSSRSRDTIRT
jgi:uncharacterized protein YqgC (DUF456 family)